MYCMKAIGQRLKQERVRLGLTQEELANIGSVHRNVQGRYERSESIPDARYLNAFSVAGGDASFVVTGRTSRSTPLNEDLLRDLLGQLVVERDESVFPVSSVPDLVIALYAHIEPTIEDDDQIEPIVDREISLLKDLVRHVFENNSANPRGG